MHTIFSSIKKHRLVWSWSVIVGLFLVLVGHAPLWPVVAGCACAIAFSTWRSNTKLKPAPSRGVR
jgi:hypothetical protein